MAAKLNTYQLACVHTNCQPTGTGPGRIRYEFLTGYIVGHAEAAAQLWGLRIKLIKLNQPATIIWRDMFFSGTDVYRVMKVKNPEAKARLGLQAW